jgi:dimethylargininase
MMLTAITRIPSLGLADCELSFLERRPIDVLRARVQHEAYRKALRQAGALVVELAPLDDLPDAAFVEDTAIVLDELAIVAPMGAATRRPESESMAAVLAAYRPVHWLRSPATLDGGDVLRLDRTLYVGQTPRTNPAAVEQLCALLAPRRYSVVPVPITKCLHLKSACSRLDDGTVLLNPEWIDPDVFSGVRTLSVAEGEPWGANTVCVGTTIITPASEPRTRASIERRGYHTASVDVSELQKAEAGVTCLSLILET